MNPAAPVTTTRVGASSMRTRVQALGAGLQPPPIFDDREAVRVLARHDGGWCHRQGVSGRHPDRNRRRARGRMRRRADRQVAGLRRGREACRGLVSGANRLDEGRLASLAGEPVAKADADTARVATGYAIGGVPPFGHATDLPVFMDRDLLGYEVVWAAAGRHDSVFEIEPERLRELSNAKVSDLKSI